jgi:hypothetical protein
LIRASAALAAVIASCGGGSSNSVSLQGSFGGESAQAKGGRAFVTVQANQSQVAGLLVITLSSNLLVCGGAAPECDTQALLLVLGNVAGGKLGAAGGAGDYTVSDTASTSPPDGATAVAVYASSKQLGGQCRTKGGIGASGVVHLKTFNSAKGQTVAGTFLVTMASGDTLSGSFSLPLCDPQAST